jgi:hypothetical protein
VYEIVVPTECQSTPGLTGFCQGQEAGLVLPTEP